MSRLTSPTVREAANEWIRGRTARGEIARETVKYYSNALSIFGDVVGHRRKVGTLTREDVDAFHEHLVGRRWSVATVRGNLVVVRQWTRWCYEEGWLERDPCWRMRVPKVPRSVPRGLKAEEVGRVLAHALDTRERLVLSLMVREGLRAMEVAGLELGDIDWRDGTLFVRHGKGGHQRLLPITNETLALVDAYIAEERGSAAGRIIQPRIPSQWNAGPGVKPVTIVNWAGRALHRAGIRDGGHALRHTYAHALIRAGATALDAQAALGHASLATTQTYLPRANVERLRNFVGRAEYHLEGAREASPQPTT